MNITLFGGSFNPPTLGHQIVMEQIFKLKLIPKLDQIWLLPEFEHSFAKNQILVDARHRLAMTQFLLRPKVKLQTCCLDRHMSGNTIDHVTLLKKIYPQHRFSFLMGSDNLKSFDVWPKWQQLLKLMTFYIYPREGFAFKPLYPGMKPLTHPQQVITNIASTMVREKIRSGKNWEDLMPSKVADYIRQKRLFLRA
ncbi:nicotinate (nicotinamide) nucleotide adenylyltransferase [Patescibacteria group bacterium]|nr:nicotinate (nicotinamide) nucleotide adenylyltransferase [Patescibacteria group bacterium]